MLISFLRYLGEKKLIDINLVGCKNDAEMDMEFKVQKYIHIAQNFGLGTKYKYDKYCGGPYSTCIMEEYWNINKNDIKNAVQLPDSFSGDEFMTTVSGRDKQWLEVATTLINMCHHYTEWTELQKHMTSMIPWYSKTYIDKVMQDIMESPLGNTIPTFN